MTGSDKVDEGMILTKEGKIEIKVPTGKITKKLPGFYNPVMKFNRDMSIAVLKVLGKDFSVGLPLAATGVRAIRIAKEAKVRTITYNDMNDDAFNLMKENCEMNGIKYIENEWFEKNVTSDNISIFKKDANQFLLESHGFDYIDIDPFGSPNPFLDSALRRLSRDGILAITATDTSSLAGTHINGCRRKYWAEPMRNELKHEVAVRILARKVQDIGTQYDRAATPILSYAKDHYVKIFFRVSKGKQRADAIRKYHGFILSCPKCHSIKTGKQNRNTCECGHEMMYAGPLYLGQIHDPELMEEIIKMKHFDKEYQIHLSRMGEEAQLHTIGFFDVHAISKSMKINCQFTFPEIIEEIEKEGYHGKRTQFSEYAIKTDMPHDKFIEILRKGNKENK